ncbi:MAG: helix-turn-helix domain-containing protein [Bacteroidota bacterium]
MSILFETLHLKHFDPDALLHILNNTEMEHQLLARDNLTLHSEQLTIGDIDITVGDYDFSVRVRGSIPCDGKVYIGLLGKIIDEVRVNRSLVQLEQLVLYAPGCELDFHTLSGSNWYMLHLSLERLQEMAIDKLGMELDWPCQGVRFIDLSPEVSERLHKELRGLLQFGKQCVNTANTEAIESLISEGMMQMLAETIVQGSCSSLSRLSPGRERALNVLEANIYHWMEYPNSGFCVSDIEGISQRLLEMACQETYGVTPHRWIKLARLNAAYRELCSDSGASVTQTCMRWGFGNMGRFSGEYRALFGEFPKETIQRVSQSVS